MSSVLLYAFPGACSQVTLYALEQAGMEYRTHLVNLAAGEQTRSAYSDIVPTKKVPALLIDGSFLLENAAILFWIASSAPDKNLLPVPGTQLDRSQQISALAFCSGTLHPVTRAIFAPQRFTDGDVDGVRAKGKEIAKTVFGYAERRFRENGWWFETESLIDVYVNWAFTTAVKGGLDQAAFPHLAQLHERLLERPAFVRVLEWEAAARKQLGL